MSVSKGHGSFRASAVENGSARWLRQRRLRRLRRHAVWIVPIACMAVALLLAPAIRWLDARTHWPLMGFGPAGAKALLSALAGSSLTFIVFAFSILLLAVQLASSQLSPRMIARMFDRRIVSGALGVFVFSFTFTIAILGRIEERALQLPVLLAILANLTSIVMFIIMIQSMGLGFRPITILTRVAEDTRKVIDALYPRQYTTPESSAPGFTPARPDRTIEHSGRSAVVVGFDAAGLVGLATRAGCTIELVPEVGDFLAMGEDLFRLHGAGAGAVDEGHLLHCLELGPERTLRQDPAFGFRIIVDIASKALSPAINDPTTAVLAIDQLQQLLQVLGQRQFDDGVARDASGQERLVYRTPAWDDFVGLAVTEIRHYGATSPQIPRRLGAMLEQLANVLPPARGEAVRREEGRLRRTTESAYADSEDRAMFAAADLQGFGSRPRGSTGKRR